MRLYASRVLLENTNAGALDLGFDESFPIKTRKQGCKTLGRVMPCRAAALKLSLVVACTVVAAAIDAEIDSHEYFHHLLSLIHI